MGRQEREEEMKERRSEREKKRGSKTFPFNRFLWIPFFFFATIFCPFSSPFIVIGKYFRTVTWLRERDVPFSRGERGRERRSKRKGSGSNSLPAVCLSSKDFTFFSGFGIEEEWKLFPTFCLCFYPLPSTLQLSLSFCWISLEPVHHNPGGHDHPNLTSIPKIIIAHPFFPLACSNFSNLPST